MRVFNKIKILKSYLIVFIVFVFVFYSYIYFFNSNNDAVEAPSHIEKVKITNINIYWWFFTVLITAGVSFLFQNRLAKNKLKLDRLDKRASFIKSIAKDLSDLVNERLYSVKVYFNGLSSGSVSQSTRDYYIKSVSEWNNRIHSIYSSLNMYDIVDLSNQIEADIHDKFVIIHGLFVENVSKGNVSEEVILKIRWLIKDISNNASYYSRVISEISDASWDKTLDKTEPLTVDNLPLASNITLVKRLFNFKSSSLSVNRSSYKE